MTALGLPYPTIIGTVAGGEWASTVMDRVVADGRYGVRLGPVAPTRRPRSCAPASPPRARRTRSCATTRRPSRSWARGSPPRGCRRTIRSRLGLAAAAKAVTGRRPALLGVPYGADMRLFIGVGDTPCVIFGPGDVRLAHGADERVPLAEVEACARVLAAWVADELGAIEPARERAPPRAVGPASPDGRFVTAAARHDRLGDVAASSSPVSCAPWCERRTISGMITAAAARIPRAV